jgi:hypothetical protein
MLVVVAGVILDRFLHKSKAVESMIHGYKDSGKKDVKISFFQNAFALIFILSSLIVFLYTLLFIG